MLEQVFDHRPTVTSQNSGIDAYPPKISKSQDDKAASIVKDAKKTVRNPRPLTSLIKTVLQDGKDSHKDFMLQQKEEEKKRDADMMTQLSAMLEKNTDKGFEKLDKMLVEKIEPALTGRRPTAAPMNNNYAEFRNYQAEQVAPPTAVNYRPSRSPLQRYNNNGPHYHQPESRPYDSGDQFSDQDFRPASHLQDTRKRGYANHPYSPNVCNHDPRMASDQYRPFEPHR